MKNVVAAFLGRRAICEVGGSRHPTHASARKGEYRASNTTPQHLGLRLIAGGSLANSPRRSLGLPHPLSWTALFYGALAWAALVGLVWFVVVVL